MAISVTHCVVFFRNEHGRSTQNIGYSPILPKIKTEYADVEVSLYGAKVYNDLPLKVRQIGNYRLSKQSTEVIFTLCSYGMVFMDFWTYLVTVL